MTRRCLRPAMVFALLTVTLFTRIEPASAVVTSSVADGVLTVTGDETNNEVAIACQNGLVKVNGANPGTGPVQCSTITSLVISTGGANDRVTLSAVSPLAYSALTSTLVKGGPGADVLEGSPLDDDLRGQGGDDEIVPGGGLADVVDGGKGQDAVVDQAVASIVFADGTLIGSGTSTLSGVEGLRLEGTQEADVIDTRAFGGRVQLAGLGGNDRLLAGPGRSDIRGGAGNDTLSGGAGSDSLLAERGDDTLRGKGGPDNLDGGDGNDSCDGGAGKDELRHCE